VSFFRHDQYKTALYGEKNELNMFHI